MKKAIFITYQAWTVLSIELLLNQSNMVLAKDFILLYLKNLVNFCAAHSFRLNAIRIELSLTL